MEQAQTETMNQQVDNSIPQDNKAEKQPTLQDVERKIFSAEKLESASEYMQSASELADASGASPILNFDPEVDFPEKYRLAILPLTERVPERGNVIKNVCFAAIPTVDQILETDSGRAFIEKVITDKMLGLVIAAAKSTDESSISALPLSIDDFTTSSRTSALAGFNAVASAFVKGLKDKGLRFMTKGLLRQVLSSASFAESQFPKIGQENWAFVINSMISHADKEGHPAGNLGHWLKTRDKVEVDAVELDLTDIEEML